MVLHGTPGAIGWRSRATRADTGLDGYELMRWTGIERVSDPALAPDGRRRAYAAAAGDNLAIYLLDITSSKLWIGEAVSPRGVKSLPGREPANSISAAIDTKSAASTTARILNSPADMADEVRNWVFPARCPNCLVREGVPVEIGSKTRLRLEVFVRCGRCLHQWRLSANRPPLILRPAGP